MINDKHSNKALPQIVENVADWHWQRNLVEGATTWTQSKKLLEEYIELVAAQMPEQSPDAIAAQVIDWTTSLLESGRIKTVKVEDAQEALYDSIGDQAVVAINICEREGISYRDALHGSYNEIKDRRGKMVNGVYVKEADLPSDEQFVGVV